VIAAPISRFGVISGMIETAENLAKDYNISREKPTNTPCAATSARPRPGPTASSTTNWCRSPCRRSKGDPKVFDHDEGYRPTPAWRRWRKLRRSMKDGVVTAGNASQQNDAAAACLVVAEDKLAELGLEPMGYLVGWAAAGCDPSRMGIGPVPAVSAVQAHRPGWTTSTWSS
jgi:acetyl-CoA C-acetyltransferase